MTVFSEGMLIGSPPSIGERETTDSLDMIDSAKD